MSDFSKLSFGKHKGKPFDEVPAGYLLWVADSDGTKSTLALCRYVRDHRAELEKMAEEEKEQFKVSKKDSSEKAKSSGDDLWD